MSGPNYKTFKFEVGQVVAHLRYGYRGAVYERDARCEAPEGWYANNQTQPERGQPWYHVLVDGAEHTTYVAESNLSPDAGSGPITHPLLSQTFGHYHDGRYHRENLN